MLSKYKLPELSLRRPLGTVTNRDSFVRNQQDEDKKQLATLDEWETKRSIGKKTARKKTCKVYSMPHHGNNPSEDKDILLQGLASFLKSLDSELQKIADIKYTTIYRNLTYCAGVYENEFSSLLSHLDKYREGVEGYWNDENNKIQDQRQKHISMMENLQESVAYRSRIAQTRERIEELEDRLEPFKNALKSLEKARIKVLKFSLLLGYDVREEGLLWIIKQLGSVPSREEFPRFLNDKEIQFIIHRYNNQKIVNEIENGKAELSNMFNRPIEQLYGYVRRKKKRQIDLIKENQEIKKLLAARTEPFKSTNHKYLKEDTLNIARRIEQEDKPRPTKYEVIYKETVRMLKKICIEETYHLSPEPQVELQHRTSRRKSTRMTSQLIKKLKGIVSQPKNSVVECEKVRSQETKLLDEISKAIRSEQGEEQHIFKRSLYAEERRPITIICCLLGWKKAKKVLETELASLFH